LRQNRARLIIESIQKTKPREGAGGDSDCGDFGHAEGSRVIRGRRRPPKPCRDCWRTPTALLFSHPAGYTPVCTTELGRVAALKDDFERRNKHKVATLADWRQGDRVIG
jgi:ribosomal protein L32E